MKTSYKNLLLGIASVLSVSSIAQVSAYQFAQSNGTYTPITGGTVIATATANTAPGNLANMVWNLPNGTFPFPFTFNGIPYTGCNISCNGHITFGAVPPTLGTPISAVTAYDGAISAWGRTTYGGFNLGTAAPFHTSELRVEVIGTAPNRTVVIQYEKWRYSGSTTTTTWLQDYQIRLIETTNIIEIVYGGGIMAGGSLTTSGFNAQVGLRGATNADFNNRSSFGLFDQSTAGTANNATQVIGVTSGVGIFMPPTGLTYRWFPPCTSSSLVTPSITATSTLLCEGDTLDFSASGETPFFDIQYQWQQSLNFGGPYTNVTAPPAGTTFASYQATATPGIFYYVLLTTCPTNTTSVLSNEIVVDVRPLPILDIFSTPALNTSVTPIETCFGETYTLTAVGAISYSWTGGPASDIFVVQPSGNPSYTVTGISIDGCDATRVLDIQVNPLPVVSMLASPNAVCPGNNVVVGASGNAVTYTWTGQNSNAFLITVSPTVSTTYSVVGTGANSCTNMATQQVVVHPLPQLVPLSSVGSATICIGEPLALSVSGASTYTWTSPSVYTIGQLISVAPIVTTTYTVTGTDLNGCVSQTTIAQAVSACVGLNDEAFGNLNGLSIYPNPNNGVFIVELSNGANKVFELMDMTGRMILSSSTSNNTTEFSINDLANGIYYLRVQSNNTTQIVKVVKQ